VKAWEPFKPDAILPGIDMARSLGDAIQDADLILLLVRHTEFVNIQPEEIALKTSARICVDCVNGWDTQHWESSGFSVYRLGVNHSNIVNHQS